MSSPDKLLIAFERFPNDTIEIWEVASGKIRGSLPSQSQRIGEMAFSPNGKRLATSSRDTTILIWDMHRPFNPGQYKKRLSEKELTAHWQTLSQSDARKADVAIWSMIYAAKDSLPFLKKHLQPVPLPDGAKLQKLFNDLNSDRFRIRQKAGQEIEKLGERAIGQLEKALNQKPSLEMHLRLKALSANAKKQYWQISTPDRLRKYRAVEVLEKMGTAEAQTQLQRLAAGAAGARLTVEAQAALRRLQSQ